MPFPFLPAAGCATARPLPSRPAALRFADCELRIEQRELLVAGAVQPVQPRVFDLLLYLVERRDRVVTRDELLHYLWQTEHVSDSVIGRCVKKARRVIGDIVRKAPFSRTLPRAGYRFVKEVRPACQAVPGAPGPVPPNARALSIVALPFHNRTGRDELVWVEFGLAALLNRELEAQRGLAVMPLVDVLALLRESDGRSPPLPRAVERIHAAGAGVVITVQVHMREDGFELRYRLHGQTGPDEGGQLHGSDLTQLTIALGRRLAAEFASREPSRLAAPDAGDSFTSEALSRARRAAMEQRYQMAQSYLQVCVASEPPALEMEVEHV